MRVSTNTGPKHRVLPGPSLLTADHSSPLTSQPHPPQSATSTVALQVQLQHHAHLSPRLATLQHLPSHLSSAAWSQPIAQVPNSEMQTSLKSCSIAQRCKGSLPGQTRPCNYISSSSFRSERSTGPRMGWGGLCHVQCHFQPAVRKESFTHPPPVC